VTAPRTAIVTGANHGIGAATARALAARGCTVPCTFLRIDDPVDPGIPQGYRERRAQDAAPWPWKPTCRIPLAQLFDLAEAQFGPVEILVNSASGWLADTFAPVAADRLC